MSETIIYQAYTSDFTHEVTGSKSRLVNAFKVWFEDCRESAIELAVRFIVWIKYIPAIRKRYKIVEKKDFFAHEFFSKMARAFAGFSLLILLFDYSPALWYVVDSAFLGDRTPQVLAETASNFKVNEKEVKSSYQPLVDPSLPLENKIIVPSLDIDTEINEAGYDTFEEALTNGVWRVSDFGTPYLRRLPTILAAHRFGYLRWSNSYRRENSFYNLPKLEVGETVEIYWMQRKYVYEIYAEEEGEIITDYTADLILYTCDSLNSPVRIIKYARLLEI